MAELARRQHGVLSRSQLHRIGLGRGAIDLRVKRGRLHKIHRGVYAVGYSLLTPSGRYMAAVLAGGNGAALSHRSAADHCGIRRTSRTAIELTAERRIQDRPGLRFHCSPLPADEVITHEGVPITIAPRTILDLASLVDRRGLEKAIAEADRQKLWHTLSLRDMLARYPRRPGVAAVKEILAEQSAADGITRSRLEDLFIAVVDRYDLPRPKINSHVEVGGSWIQPDFAWPEQRLIVELDGFATHGGRHSFESDRARDRALAVAGWRVVRITWRQLHEEPERIARDLWTLLS